VTHPWRSGDEDATRLSCPNPRYIHALSRPIRREASCTRTPRTRLLQVFRRFSSGSGLCLQIVVSSPVARKARQLRDLVLSGVL
jgi:hypothetical protein